MQDQAENIIMRDSPEAGAAHLTSPPSRGFSWERHGSHDYAQAAHASPREARPSAGRRPDSTHEAARPLTFMFLPLGWVLAHTSRCIEIAKVLRERGHHVVFAGDDPDHPRSKLDLVRRAGFPLRYAKEPFQPYAWDRFVKYGWMASTWDLANLRHWAPLQEIIEGHVELIRKERPNVVVGDASVSASTAAYIAGVPAACIMNAYASHFLTRRSIFHPALQVYDRLHLARIRRRVFAKYNTKPVNSLRLLRSIPLLSPDLPGMYQTPKFFPKYHTVGPIFSEHPSPLPKWYEELDDGATNVYITMGSTGFLDAFLRAIYPVFSRLPHRFIVTTGGQASPETIAAAPENFRITDFAPGSQILRHCQAMIFHGGNGTMYQALAAGVPMLAMPSHLEQQVIADIAVKLGYCIRMKARKFNPDALVRNLNRLIEDRRYRDAARRFSLPIRASNGPARAAELLERIAREGKPAGAELI